MISKLFEQVLNERDIKSILFNTDYSFDKAKKIALNQLNVANIDNSYDYGRIVVYNKDGSKDVYLRGDDNAFYKAKLVDYKRPIYKQRKVDNPDYEPGELPYAYEDTDEIIDYADDKKYEIDKNNLVICPQEIVEYCKYSDDAIVYKRRRKKLASKEPDYISKHNSDLRVERLPDFEYQEFESLEGSDDGDIDQEVWGTWKLYYKNNFLGYVGADGVYTFNVSSETTYHSSGTYWDPPCDEGTATAEYSSGDLNFTFWEKDSTLDEIDGEGPMDLNMFLNLQIPSIRPIIKKYLTDVIEKDLKFEANESWDWSY